MSQESRTKKQPPTKSIKRDGSHPEGTCLVGVTRRERALSQCRITMPRMKKLLDGPISCYVVVRSTVDLLD